MTDSPKDYNQSPAPPTENTENIENSEKVEHWFYFEDNENFLLRFGEFCNKKNEKIIIIEAANTEEISEDKITYREYYKTKDFMKYLKLDEENKNLDPKTYLAKGKYISAVHFQRDECTIQFATENKKFFSCILKKQVENDIFFNMNIHRKLKQIKKKLESDIKSLTAVNKKINNENIALKNNLVEIRKYNSSLSEDNDKISTYLNDLKRKQEEAISQLEALPEKYKKNYNN